METVSTRQVAARIRHGKLPEYDRGYPCCACHPKHKTRAHTESLRFWSKGDHIQCTKAKREKMVPALAVFPALGITIDTRL